MDSRTDEELLVLVCRRGEKAVVRDTAVTVLLKRHGKSVRVYIKGFGHRCNATTAEDLYQEVWANLWERGSYISPKAKAKTYLYTIARNIVLDHIRRCGKIVEEPVPDEGPGWEPVESPSDLSIDLEKALDQLPVEQREAFTLFAVVGMTAREIASVQQVNENTAKSRIKLARDKLKDFEPLRIYFETRKVIEPKRPSKESCRDLSIDRAAKAESGTCSAVQNKLSFEEPDFANSQVIL